MKPKHLPRLWCALQGLLPFEACIRAQEGELAWPRDLLPVPRPLDAKAAITKTPARGATRSTVRKD